jgi:alpha-beta hydrolase superfamily lysophospholipase
MSTDPILDVVPARGDPRAVALVLHGGRENSRVPVRPTNLAVLRMAPFASSLRRAGRRHGLAVARLRYLVRGWNGTSRSPVADVAWALDRLAERYPSVPVALVGHSMGGRAAIYSAAHPSVRAVVGLAPWVERGDPVETMTGRHLLVAHGDRDRITSPKGSASWTRQAAVVTESAGYVTIKGEGHAMVQRAALWHSLATSYVLAVLCGVHPPEAGGSPGATVIGKVLAGEVSLVV